MIASCGGAGNANCCGGAGNASCCCGAGAGAWTCGINPCVVACESVITGDKVVLSRHNENLNLCSMYENHQLLNHK